MINLSAVITTTGQFIADGASRQRIVFASKTIRWSSKG